MIWSLSRIKSESEVNTQRLTDTNKLGLQMRLQCYNTPYFNEHTEHLRFSVKKVSNKRWEKFSYIFTNEGNNLDRALVAYKVDCAKFNAQGKSGSKSCPPIPKKWKNQGVSSGSREASSRDNQKLTLTADYQRNKSRKPNDTGMKAFATEMCPLCRAKHAMWKCSKFCALRAKERRAEVRKLRLCFHCLNSGHRVSACKF